MKTEEIIKKFNEMLHNGKHTPEQAYQWMIIEKNKQDHEFYLKHGYHLFNDYNYLYPEILYKNK